MAKRFELKQFGLDVIMRHDYEDKEIGKAIHGYQNKSVKAFKDFLTNVPGSENFDSFLDIGCGDDNVINQFQYDNKRCYGIDLYMDAGDYTANNINDDGYGIVREDFYECGRSSNHPVNQIFINHTLEHAANAPLLLQNVSALQKKGDALFIAVPDGDFPWAYDITSSTTHWSIFNEGFLRTILQRFGYNVCVEKRCFREGAGELWAFAIKQ